MNGILTQELTYFVMFFIIILRHIFIVSLLEITASILVITK